MPKDDTSLKRLGGGRWETRDGRFAIEPQSGTWVVVDSETTDELGLPLVRGPFGSLGAAKEAITTARAGAPVTSPLADQLAKPPPKADAPAPGGGRTRPTKRAAETSKRPSEPPPEPAPPPEPRWLTDLPSGDQRRVRQLVEQLRAAGYDDAEHIAREEVAHDQPAVARAVLERRLAGIAGDGPEGVRAGARRAAELLARGADRDLGVRWRLVDGEGREIGALELSE